jgi:hypothetical protein
MTAKRKWLAAVAVGIVAATAIFHATLLRGLAGFLVADGPAGDFQYVGILDGHGLSNGAWYYDTAAKLRRQKPACGFLIVQFRRNRLVETGVLSSFDAFSRRALEVRGVPPQTISTITSDGYDDWAEARALQTWLADRPAASVLLPCGRFGSAHLRCVLHAVLDPEQAARVQVLGLPDRRFNETNWWTTRAGIKAFGFSWLRQLHGWWAGGGHPPPPSQNAADYEHDVRQALAEGSL